MEVKNGKAYEYAAWCVSESKRMVPMYVKKQAESWINIVEGNDQDAYVDDNAYQKICRLLKIMIHPDLRCTIYEGLEDYAWFFIVAILCTKVKGTDTDIRFYTNAVLEIARKNFKTFNSAVIFILLMLMEPDFSRFFSVAPDLALSSELKNAIRKIIKVSPALIDEEEPAFKILRSQIICLLNDNEYTPLAYSKDGMDGKLANAFLADEAGALDEYPVEAMRSSQITLLSKLGIIISTQYPNDNNVMLDEIDIAKKTLDGLLDDRRTFALLYEPDDDLKVGENWQKDERVLCQSNPVALRHDYIMDELKRKRELAVLYENKRENFLCKHCNILYKGLGVEGFVDIQKVKLCKIEDNKEFWKGRKVWLGLDLSETDDNTALAMACEENGIVYAKNFVKYGLMDAISDFESALNRSLLLEKEKGKMFWQFDVTELTKGDIDKRYNAYSVGIEKGFLQTDEVRKRENLPPLDMNFVKLGLQDGLYDPKSKTVYVLNTNKAVCLDDLKPTKGGEKQGELNSGKNPSLLTDMSTPSEETVDQSETEGQENDL